MGPRKAVGSLIGIGFLLMILSLGFSYYNLVDGVEGRTQDVLIGMQEFDRNAADEELDIHSVELTNDDSLNLTIKNTGNVFSEIKWIGVFDETLNTQEYYSVSTSLNPVETQKDIGNSSIVMNPANTYRIQVLTKLGNIYYEEYPITTTGGTTENEETQYYFVDHMVDSQTPTATGTHSLFTAMQAGPDEVYDTLTEETSAGSIEGQINDVLPDSLVYDSDKGKTPALIQISNDVYAIAYSGDGDDGLLATVTIAAHGDISTQVTDTLRFDTGKGKTPEIIAVSGDIYAIAYTGDGDNGMLVTVEITESGTITDTVIDSFEFQTDKGKTPSICHVDDDIYAIAYCGDNDYGYLATVEIQDNGDISAMVIDSLVYDSDKGKEPSILHVSEDIYAVAYSGDNDYGYLATVEILVNGDISAAVIDSLVYDSDKGKTPDTIAVSGDIYAIAYTGDGDAGRLVTVTIAANGDISTQVIDTLTFDPDKGKTPEIIAVSGDIYAIAYSGDGDDGTLVTVTIAVNGDISTQVIDTLTFDPDKGKTPTLIQVSNDVFAIAYTGDGDDGHVSTVNFLEGGADYFLDLEVAWSGLPSRVNEYLSIYGGSMGAEGLKVDYWDGGAWVNLIPSLSSGGNTVDVSGILSGSSFTIRFVDETQTSDAVQDTWEIDCAYLNLFD